MPFHNRIAARIADWWRITNEERIRRRQVIYRRIQNRRDPTVEIRDLNNDAAYDDVDSWVCEQCFGVRERDASHYVKLYCQCQMIMCLPCYTNRVAELSRQFNERIMNHVSYTPFERPEQQNTGMAIEAEMCYRCDSWIPFILPLNIIERDEDTDVEILLATERLRAALRRPAAGNDPDEPPQQRRRV